MRFDVALFELRLFKSRSQAQQAIAAGEVMLNGAATKPNRDLHPGDRITLAGPGAHRTVEVLELPHASLSKDAAKALLRDVAGD